MIDSILTSPPANRVWHIYKVTVWKFALIDGDKAIGETRVIGCPKDAAKAKNCDKDITFGFI